MSIACINRIKKELDMLANDPGPGITAWSCDDNKMVLQAQIQGPSESPFAEGSYTLTINIPDRYPFEPPRVRFITPIYHPNIDSDGRICLDTLKMQPQGSWSPSININTLLLTIRVLMANPNADDGLVPEITEEYKRDRSLWRKKAEAHTKSNAVISMNSIDNNNNNSNNNNNNNNNNNEKITKTINNINQNTNINDERNEKSNYDKDNNQQNDDDNSNDNEDDDDDDDDNDDDDNDDDDNDNEHDEKRSRHY